MNARHAAEIRRGILTARERPWRPGVLTVLNSRHYSKLAVEAFNVYRRRQARMSSEHAD